MTKIFVIGHTSPDLDSVVAAVAYKKLLKQTRKYPETEVIAVTAGETNIETAFVFNKFGIELPEKLDEGIVGESDKFILVDHNEESQRHKYIKSEQILEIIDHHKTNLTLNTPIEINIKPLGSTSTIVYKLAEQDSIELTAETKQLLLSAIISDTQGFNSPTTTDTDKDLAQKLAQSLDINTKDLIFEIFKAKSDITGLSMEKIVTKDFKIFEFGNHKVFINQIETVESQEIIAKKEDAVKILQKIKAEKNVEYAFNVVTDILNLKSTVIYATEQGREVLEKAFNTTGQDNIIDIGNRISRKKQIAPAIEKALC